MDPKKEKGARMWKEETGSLLFAWGPVHLIGCHSPQDSGQLAVAVCLCKNKVALLISCCGRSVLAPGSCPGLQAPVLGSGSPAGLLIRPSFLETGAMWPSTHPLLDGVSRSSSQQPAVLRRGQRVRPGRRLWAEPRDRLWAQKHRLAQPLALVGLFGWNYLWQKMRLNFFLHS